MNLNKKKKKWKTRLGSTVPTRQGFETLDLRRWEILKQMQNTILGCLSVLSWQSNNGLRE
jgi:hypothetical protein